MNQLPIKDRAIKSWGEFGLNDLFTAFIISDHLPWRAAGFYTECIEKLGKAYIIGKEENNYKNKDEPDAIKFITDIAKEYSHHLIKKTPSIITKLIEYNILPVITITQKFGKFSGKELLEALEAAYEKSRYPMPFDEKTTNSILIDSDLTNFAYFCALKILTAIKNDFSIDITAKLFNRVSTDDDLRRFKNILEKHCKNI